MTDLISFRFESLPFTCSESSLPDGSIVSRLERLDIESMRAAVYMDGIRHFVAEAWAFCAKDGVVAKGEWDAPAIEPDEAQFIAYSGATADDSWFDPDHDSVQHALRLVRQGFLSKHSFARATYDAEWGPDSRLVIHCGDFFAASSRWIEAVERAKPENQRKGFLYVVGFSTGVVKVGKARDVRSRVSQHRAEAEKFGVRVARHWISKPHARFDETEKSLIAGCVAEARLHAGREYFRIEFDRAVAIAESLELSDFPWKEPTGPAFVFGMSAAERRWDRLNQPKTRAA